MAGFKEAGITKGAAGVFRTTAPKSLICKSSDLIHLTSLGRRDGGPRVIRRSQGPRVTLIILLFGSPLF